jgi:radical SAM protein with 4Fe4S-binding SPASM domain
MIMSTLKAIPLAVAYDSESHYAHRPIAVEHADLDECEVAIQNIGWTLGNDCPYRCKHCYSMSARRKGQDLSRAVVDRVVDQLIANGIETVNLGGNEPIFTNGMNIRESLLPYIITRLTEARILVGLTTSGVSAVQLERHHPNVFAMLNDCDVSFDSPNEQEHNKNRGSSIFREAIQALELCQRYDIDRTVIMCAMGWNFDRERLAQLVALAKAHDANVRINPIKTVEASHLALKLTPEQYYDGFSFLMEQCSVVDLGEPPLATMTRSAGARGCPCGRTSFRIHAITPEGEIPVSPCVYLHDYKCGNLVTDDLYDIIHSPAFKTFRRRNRNAERIPGCEGCDVLDFCRGGCAARAYLAGAHSKGTSALFSQDPYCPKQFDGRWTFPQNPQIEDIRLVHQNYLCTWIGRPL